MHWIRNDLTIGKLRETLDADLLKRMGIGAMLQLCRDVPQPGIPYLFLGIEDGEPLDAETLKQGITFIQEQRAAGNKVLVACGRGISRSTTFAIATLRETEGGLLLPLFAEILAVHPEARPHPVLWRSLCIYFGEPFSLVEMVRLSNRAFANIPT